jgi:hypothetical protein
MAGHFAVAFAKPFRQMPLVNLPRQNRLRVAHVDDLVEPRTEHVVLTGVQDFTRLHGTLQISVWRSESQEIRHGNLQEKRGQNGKFLKMENREFAEKRRLIRYLADVHGRLPSYSKVIQVTPSTIFPPCSVLSPMRATLIPSIVTTDEPLVIFAWIGTPVHMHLLPTTATGTPETLTSD